METQEFRLIMFEIIDLLKEISNKLDSQETKSDSSLPKTFENDLKQTNKLETGQMSVSKSPDSPPDIKKEKIMLNEIINRLPDKEITKLKKHLFEIWRKYHPIKELDGTITEGRRHG